MSQQKNKSTESVKKITILSAYNRALWLSIELKRQGFDVCYLDFTNVLGDLSPDAWDSPFGIFQTKNTSFSQTTWISEGANLDVQDNGFILYSNKGPIEFRGPTSRLALKRYGIPDEQMDYVRQSVFYSDKEFIDQNKKVLANSFHKRWFLNYVHQANSPVFMENYKGMEQQNKPLPLNENWILRKMSRRGSQQTLQMTNDKGVMVDEVVAIQSIEIESRKVKSLKWTNRKNMTRENTSDVFINFLSQEELQVVSPPTFEKLFNGKAIYADWFWSRYRFFIQRNDVIDILPKAFALIHHRSLPWTHENNLVIQRGIRDDEFIVWCRIPYHYRHQKSLIESLGDRIHGVLKHHFHQVQVVSSELPLECLPTEYQVKAPHLPVFNEDTLSKMKKCKYSNFTWFGPEVWGRLDIGYLLDLQTQIINQILGTEEKMGISRRRGRDNEIYS